MQRAVLLLGPSLRSLGIGPSSLPLSSSSVNPVASASRSLSLCAAAANLSEAASTPDSGPAPPLRKTLLNAYHRDKLHGKMVPFAGWEMPVVYDSATLVESHLHTRRAASLFDVSHMIQLKIKGKHKVQFVERLTPAGVRELGKGQHALSMITTKEGGILDDLMVGRYRRHLFMVINAGHDDIDIPVMKNLVRRMRREGKVVSLHKLSGRNQLFALQGPKAPDVMATLIENPAQLSSWYFMTGRNIVLGGIPCFATRSGYTGEDGFEISVKNSRALELWQKLESCKVVPVLPAGLGARDSLRLEAGLCLHGHDISTKTSPVEAGLMWTIPKNRREKGGFAGAKIIMDQMAAGPAVKRVGFMLKEGAPAREGAVLTAADGTTQIGTVTSGTLSPVLKKPLGMAYVKTESSKIGTTIKTNIRGRVFDGEICKMPFVPNTFYRAPTPPK